MDVIKFAKEHLRLCNSYKDCHGCPIYEISGNDQSNSCADCFFAQTQKYVEIVEKWSKEYLQKTILDDFKEKYPNAKYGEDTYPEVCPELLGYKIECDERCAFCDCGKVWNTPLEEATK